MNAAYTEARSMWEIKRACIASRPEMKGQPHDEDGKYQIENRGDNNMMRSRTFFGKVLMNACQCRQWIRIRFHYKTRFRKWKGKTQRQCGTARLKATFRLSWNFVKFLTVLQSVVGEGGRDWTIKWICEIWGSHSGIAKQPGLLDFYAVSTGIQLRYDGS